ncbi:MAG: radical SAM protein [Desulfurococcaceae archaeon]|nr:radical SAM protein [Desulfurococcaceae archaeon]
MYDFEWILMRRISPDTWSSRVLERLKWYYEVMIDRKPAKFLICRKVGLGDSSLSGYTYEELLDIHNRLSNEFKKLFEDVRYDKLSLKEFKRLEEPKTTYLDVKIELVKRILRSCSLCEWRCGVNRYEVKGIMCRLDTRTYVSSYFLHVGEEPQLIPSGTIFYGSCNFRCVFCQNYEISQVRPYDGIEVNPKELSLIQKYLRESGAKNINHVGGEPTPNLLTILESLKLLDVNVPQLWNSNLYLTTQSLTILLDVIDIWLPDFKYGNNVCAQRLSKVKNYFDIVSRNHKIICENKDPIIIRHLVMPNHVECCSKPILEWIASNCPHALVNIMDQYRPEYLVITKAEEYRDIARRPSHKELEEVYEYARKLKIAFEEVSK